MHTPTGKKMIHNKQCISIAIHPMCIGDRPYAKVIKLARLSVTVCLVLVIELLVLLYNHSLFISYNKE